MRGVGGLALVHVAANAVLLTAGYYWLGVGEARTSTLVWSFTVALVAIALAAWAYGAPFVFFPDRRLDLAYRLAFRNLAPLTIATLMALVLYYLLALWAGYSATPASPLASYLTLKLRRPVSPNSVLRIFNLVLWAIRWVVVPVLVIPVLGNIASQGWRGFREFRSLRWFYWLLVPLVLVCGVLVPFQLLSWVPRVGSFGAEMASFVLRALLAYLLFVAGWLLLAFLTSGGRPTATQLSTVASP